MTSVVPVLMYHHVSDDREITLKGFENQIRFLAEHGFNSLSLTDFYLHSIGKKTAPYKSVLITFDDGYADNWICAYPILKKYGFKATVFVVTSKITDSPIRPNLDSGAKSPDTQTSERGTEGFLSWDELREMYETQVFDIGSHTHTHKEFDKHRRYADVKGELAQSKDIIERKLNMQVTSVAWPWGHYEEDFVNAARDTGYKLAFTTQPGANVSFVDPFRTRRFKIRKDSITWFRSRLLLYRIPIISELYGMFYGLDSAVKRLLKGR
jgi:peptidoglycan/xylan/chitin deacetylase (PgdA/CDA1 family)